MLVVSDVVTWERDGWKMDRSLVLRALIEAPSLFGTRRSHCDVVRGYSSATGSDSACQRTGLDSERGGGAVV